MNLIDLSIRRPVFAWVLMSALIIFGAISANRLGISQIPDVDFPVLTITVPYEGAAPDVVESEILERIEQRLLAIEGIKEMRSSAVLGQGQIKLEFEISRNVDLALQEVQAALSQLRLPPGVDLPIIRKTNPEEEPILTFTIYGGPSIREMRNWIEEYLLDQIQFLPGVGEVAVAGFPVRNLRIWIDPEKLKIHNFTVADVTETLRIQHMELSAGQFVEDKRELRVRLLGETMSAEEVADIRILRRGGQLIDNQRIFRIKDVARVEDGLSDIRRLARFDNKEAIFITVRKQRNTNEVTVAESVMARLEELKPNFPAGYNYRINVDFTRSTKATVGMTVEKLWIAALITIFICFLFLGSIQAAVNILFSIPTSIVGTFIILYFSGFTLNIFTLLALTLAISIVVDDAIMLLENIVRHYRMGKRSDVAASEGSKEVLPAAIAATLAVVAIFLPVTFMGGVIGKFFYQFGVTMSAAVLLSLLEAMTITPMRAAAFLKTDPKISRFEHMLEEFFDRLGKLYARLLAPTLKWRKTTVAVTLVGFLLSLYLVQKVRQEFLPAQDQNLIIVTAQTPPGTALEVTNAKSRELESAIKENPHVASYLVSVGGGGSSGNNASSIFMPLVLTPKETRPVTHLQVMDQLRTKFREVKRVRVSQRDISARNFTTGRLNPVAFNIRGPDLDILEEKSKEIIERLEKEKVVVDMDTDYRKGAPELMVKPDRVAMAMRGVSVESLSRVLQTAIGGFRQGEFTANGKRYDIRFKIPDALVRSSEDIQDLQVRNFFGNLISVKDLVRVEEKSVVQTITRVNRQRAISIYGNLAPGMSQSKVLERVRAVAQEVLPKSYSFALEGASSGFKESFESLYSALVVGIIVAYMILAIQFNSFVHPVSVLMALPFSVTGALIILWLTNTSMNLFSFIGLIVLMGIAKKNSILLVEFANQVRNNEKLNPTEALLKACPIRLRPIIMTSVATVAAALPLIFGNSIGSETRTAMGLPIIGGTIVSTLLTLFVVPAIYLMLTKLEKSKSH